MTRPEAERIAVVETKVDAIHDRLDHTGQQTLHLHAKIDKILEGQQQGSADRAELRREMAGIKTDIADMKPHVATVEHAKAFWAGSGKIGATFTAIGAAGYSIYVALKPYLATK